MRFRRYRVVVWRVDVPNKDFFTHKGAQKYADKFGSAADIYKWWKGRFVRNCWVKIT